jgi:hypothetical protein
MDLMASFGRSYNIQGGTQMSKRTRYLLWLIALAIFDIIIPLPLTAALMMFVVLRRPSWFREMVSDVYEPAP